MFIRFVECEDDDLYWMTGIITVAKDLRDAGALQDYEAALIGDIFEWFNDNLPVPPFRANLESGDWTEDAVCWFRDDAKDLIARMWDIVAILREHGVPVRVLRSKEPGEIVYTDEYQVVAEYLLRTTQVR